MGRQVAIQFSENHIKMLLRGEKITINIPSDASQLEITLKRKPQSAADKFRDIFNEMYARKNPYDDFSF